MNDVFDDCRFKSTVRITRRLLFASNVKLARRSGYAPPRSKLFRVAFRMFAAAAELFRSSMIVDDDGGDL